MLICYNKMILFYSYINVANLLKGKLLFFVKIIFNVVTIILLNNNIMTK